MNTPIVLTLTLLFSTFCIAENCGLSPSEEEALHNDRIATIAAEGDRYQYDWVTFLNVSERIYTPDSTYIVQGTGTFAPAPVHIEYSLGTVPNPSNGFDPQSRLFFQYDPSTVQANGNEYRLKRTVTLLTKSVIGGPTYDRQVGGIRTSVIYLFENCTSRIQIETASFAPDLQAAFADVLFTLTPEFVCGFIFNYSCGPEGLLSLTGYSSIAQCVEEMSSYISNITCPDVFSSFTYGCLLNHAVAALYNGTVHCPHVQTPSPVCIDKCIGPGGGGGCNNCSSNAHCDYSVDDNTLELSYFCTCNKGYVGDGYTCSEKSCTDDSSCGLPYGKCNNETGLCTCANDTFTWFPENEEANCGCKENEVIDWKNDVPNCLRIGNCINVADCSNYAGFNTNDAQCKETVPSNPYIYGDFCLCNPGFENQGFENSCECGVTTNKTRKWSPEINGNVCLEDYECTEPWHCDPYANCIKEEGNLIGVCEHNTSKRDVDTIQVYSMFGSGSVRHTLNRAMEMITSGLNYHLRDNVPKRQTNIADTLYPKKLPFYIFEDYYRDKDYQRKYLEESFDEEGYNKMTDDITKLIKLH